MKSKKHFLPARMSACLKATLLALVTVAAAAAPLLLHAQTYPDHVIKLIVAYPPGRGNDTLGRLVAQRLSTTLGQQVIVDNRPGAGGNLGTEQAASDAFATWRKSAI